VELSLVWPWRRPARARRLPCCRRSGSARWVPAVVQQWEAFGGSASGATQIARRRLERYRAASAEVDATVAGGSTVPNSGAATVPWPEKILQLQYW
jgi:hypothetical protein